MGVIAPTYLKLSKITVVILLKLFNLALRKL